MPNFKISSVLKLFLCLFVSITEEKIKEESSVPPKRDAPNLRRANSSDLAERILELKEALSSPRNNLSTKTKSGGKWCWTVCLTKLVPFSFAYLIFFCQSLTTLIWMFVSKMSMYINEMLLTVLVFTVSTCQVNKQFSFLGLTQKSNLKKVTSFLISVHVTAV